MEEWHGIGTVWGMHTMRERLTRTTTAIVLTVFLAAVTGCSGERMGALSEGGKELALKRCGAIFEATRQLECYQKHFQRIRETEGVAAALDQVVSWQRNPNGGSFTTYCHEVLHDLGVAEMQGASGETGRIKVLAGANITCTGGYVHGALTAYYENLDEGEIVERYQTLCRDMVGAVSTAAGRDSDTTGWLSWNCNHMLGHEIYKASGADLVAGASLCGVFELESDQRYGCEAGFYMEHYLVMGRTSATGYAKAEKLEDVHELCRDVPENVVRGCWSESGGMIYSYSDWDWGKAGEACRRLAEGEVTLKACYEGLGRNIAPYAGYEPDQMMEWCREIGDAYAVETCAIHIARAMAMELAMVDEGLRICDALIVDTERGNLCRVGVRNTGEQLAGSGFDGGVGTWDRS